MKISLIVPCYNEQEVLRIFHEEATKVIDTELSQFDAEILFIDDGSKDDTLKIIKELSKKDDRVRYVSFSRNFGKEAAIYAGLSHASGDFIAIMDADLQDPPSLLPQMIRALIEEDYDIVGTRRSTRKNEPPIRSFFARMFYKIINKISETEIVDGARDFQLMKKKVVDAILEIGEYNRFSKGIFDWVGFRKKWLSYENIERAAGQTKWSFWKLFKYAIEGIVAFTTAPLIWSTIIGAIFCIIAFVVFLVVFVKTLLFGDPVGGWPSLVCLIMMVSGVQLFCIGVMGQYLAKTYLETKNRPIYIVGESNTDKDEN